jgi:probable HAF family extracellular repeat protein
MTSMRRALAGVAASVVVLSVPLFVRADGDWPRSPGGARHAAEAQDCFRGDPHHRHDHKPSFDFKTIDAPDAPAAGGTAAEGINAQGDIVGLYPDSEGASHGFLVRNRRITTIDFPGAANTAARGINARGDIAGEYDDGVNSHGFVLSRGRFTTITPPGAIGSFARGINSRGDIVGQYRKADDVPHSFLYSRGSFADIDLPAVQVTAPRAINAGGDIVGFYTDDAGNNHGFEVIR